jgi:hypothetical protein
LAAVLLILLHLLRDRIPQTDEPQPPHVDAY